MRLLVQLNHFLSRLDPCYRDSQAHFRLNLLVTCYSHSQVPGSKLHYRWSWGKPAIIRHVDKVAPRNQGLNVRICHGVVIQFMDYMYYRTIVFGHGHHGGMG